MVSSDTQPSSFWKAPSVVLTPATVTVAVAWSTFFTTAVAPSEPVIVAPILNVPLALDSFKRFVAVSCDTMFAVIGVAIVFVLGKEPDTSPTKT